MRKSIIYAGSLNMFCWLLLAKTHITGSIQENFIGCYYDDVNNQSGLQKITLRNNNTLTIELCIRLCLRRNSTYARLENSEACICGNNFGVSLPDTSCNSLCPGNQSQYCGGSNRQRAFYSLYAVCEISYYGHMCDQLCHCKRQAPCDRMTGKCPNECEAKWFGTTCSSTTLSEKYIGCFRDNEDRAISQEHHCDARMTVDVCSNSCILRNNSIVGLQARCHCFCGETYAKYGPRDEYDCMDECSGNRRQKCGGGWANSVYSVCPAGYYGPKCHNQCHCFNNSRCVYLTGKCNSTCKAGWTGNSCNIRDCKKENGDCSQNETCATIDLNFATITRCSCLPGYERKAFWDILCRDVDECKSGTSSCNPTSENCVNNIGSYRCECKDGFESMSGQCEDIDECGNDSHVCHIETELCKNTIGSYKCHCKSGYENTTFGTECNSSPTTGIILGTLLAISLLINALFVVYQMKSAKSRNSESGKGMAQSSFQRSSKMVSEQHENEYDDTPEPVGQKSIYEQIKQKKRRVVLNPTSEYAILTLDD